jgi:hypothetical protein
LQSETSKIIMKAVPSPYLRPVFTPVENSSDQPQFGRQVCIGRLPDFPLLLEREMSRGIYNVTRANDTKNNSFHKRYPIINFEESHLSPTPLPSRGERAYCRQSLRVAHPSLRIGTTKQSIKQLPKQFPIEPKEQNCFVPRRNDASPRRNGSATRLYGNVTRRNDSAPRLYDNVTRRNGSAPRLCDNVTRRSGSAPRLYGNVTRCNGSAPQLCDNVTRCNGSATRFNDNVTTS